MTDYAPILVLGYKRPDHLLSAIASLKLNPEASKSAIYIAIDGPKSMAEETLVKRCREIAHQVTGFKELHVWSQERNIGLAKSVISNVSRILELHKCLIVVEEDLVVSSDFLRFMNLSLAKYEHEDIVASVHGFQYPINLHENECVFMRGTDCWGWATWADRWCKANFNSLQLISSIELAGLRSEFDLDGVVNNFRMLQDQAAGKIDSWAIRWHASMFVRNMITLFPPKTLVLNNGLDGSGTHEGESRIFSNSFETNAIWTYPKEVQVSQDFVHKLKRFYRIVKYRQVLNRVSLWPVKFLKLMLGKFV